MMVYKLVLAFASSLGLVFWCLLGVAVFRKRPMIQKACLGFALLLVCGFGNRYVPDFLAHQLEWQHLPAPEWSLDRAATNTAAADAIVALGGCLYPQEVPRQTPKLNEAGDRVAYAAMLYRKGMAPIIICSGGHTPMQVPGKSEAHDMAKWLELTGVSTNAIVLEEQSKSTLENATFTAPILRERKCRRILLVTSAMHMPRALGVFKHACPDVEIIPAPTDFTSTQRPNANWSRFLADCAPSAKNLYWVDSVMHEYLGILFYQVQGVMD